VPHLTATPSPTATQTTTPTPGAGCFESGDNTARQPITVDAVHQFHNLCPVGDEDWVQFYAQQGITYTLSTANVGVDGDTVLLLYNQCAEPTPAAASDPAFGNGVDLAFEAPESGNYYLKVKHHADSYGAAANYELFVNPSTTCQGDALETDDTCATARDITVGAHRPAPVSARRRTPTGSNSRLPAAPLTPRQHLQALTHPSFQVFDQCGTPRFVGGQTAGWTAPTVGRIMSRLLTKTQMNSGFINLRAMIRMTACGPTSMRMTTPMRRPNLSPRAARNRSMTSALPGRGLGIIRGLGRAAVCDRDLRPGPDAIPRSVCSELMASQIVCDDDQGAVGLAHPVDGACWPAHSTYG
jgi:hypothetical protein